MLRGDGPPTLKDFVVHCISKILQKTGSLPASFHPNWLSHSMGLPQKGVVFSILQRAGFSKAHLAFVVEEMLLSPVFAQKKM